MLKELGRNDGLGVLDLTPSQVPPVLILRVRASPQIPVAKSLGGHPDLRAHEGPIYTTAALLAESEAQIAEWHHQGFIAVDMETATAFAVAESFGMWRASILYVFDNPWQREHLLLTDAVKDARRASTAVIARDLAFSIAVDLGRAGMMQRGAR